MDVKKELEDIVEKIPDSYFQNIGQRDDLLSAVEGWINNAEYDAGFEQQTS